MSPICLECDEPYASCGDDSGVCAGCRDIIASRPQGEGCTIAELEAYIAAERAKQARRWAFVLSEKRQRRGFNDNRPVSEQTGHAVASLFKEFLK